MRMVEKVARAQYYATPRNKPFEQLSAVKRIAAMKEAQAAIAAMREPDDDMAKAGIAAWEKSPMAVVTQFRAMIDKALESGE